MIIQCINCKKKFQVNSTLIPDEGRNIQCGSCNHTWFYNPKQDVTFHNSSEIKVKNNDLSPEIKEENVDTKKQKTKVSELQRNLNQIESVKKSQKKKSKGNFNIGKVLSYFVVAIITFIALIIILDTFKSPLNNIFPSLEFLLYNLFESVKDVSLFLNNLIE